MDQLITRFASIQKKLRKEGHMLGNVRIIKEHDSCCLVTEETKREKKLTRKELGGALKKWGSQHPCLDHNLLHI